MRRGWRRRGWQERAPARRRRKRAGSLLRCGSWIARLGSSDGGSAEEDSTSAAAAHLCYDPPSMDAFLVSTGIVALAEIGDKTQLLAFLLAARFRRPLPIVAGIFVATVANHAFAAAIGTWITGLLGPDTLRWVLGASFLAMAVWTLVPD